MGNLPFCNKSTLCDRSRMRLQLLYVLLTYPFGFGLLRPSLLNFPHLCSLHQTKLDFGSPKPPRREVLEEEASIDFVFIPPETKERVLTEHQKEVKRTKRLHLSVHLFAKYILFKKSMLLVWRAKVFFDTGLTSLPCTTTLMLLWIQRFSASTHRAKKSLCKCWASATIIIKIIIKIITKE